MKYISTRGNDFKENSLKAIQQGLAKDGGLFVPETFPALDLRKLQDTCTTYDKTAATVIHSLFDDISMEALEDMTHKAYVESFYVENAVELHEINNVCIMELYHGSTGAFKDFALSILPLFMQQAMEDEKIAILTATSGDTGKAALEGFKDVKDTQIIAFYPKGGVSSVQKQQMITQEGANVCAVAIEGNFDDAQKGVKAIFESEMMNQFAKEHGYQLSSANSINIGRLVPQIVYYIWSYLQLVDQEKIEFGDKVNVCVPTGNFGDILGAYYAKKMGLPVDQLICASNENRVLTDFFSTGVYDANRDLKLTNSPSMDILVSSNLERLLYDVTKNSEQIQEWMRSLKDDGIFKVDKQTLINLSDFHGYTCDEEKTLHVIKRVFEEQDYLIDTHTAVAWDAMEAYRKETGDEKMMLIASTASPYKFPEDVAKALGLDSRVKEEKLFEQIFNKTAAPIPKCLEGVWNREITQQETIQRDEMAAFVKEKLRHDKN